MHRITPLLILLLATVVSAQTFRGTILGTVTDPNGAVVAGATITVKNTNTGIERTTTTDSEGNYTVAELPVGPYEVRVEQPGFTTLLVSKVTVEVASERRVDVTASAAFFWPHSPGGQSAACGVGLWYISFHP